MKNVVRLHDINFGRQMASVSVRIFWSNNNSSGEKIYDDWRLPTKKKNEAFAGWNADISIYWIYIIRFDFHRCDSYTSYEWKHSDGVVVFIQVGTDGWRTMSSGSYILFIFVHTENQAMLSRFISEQNCHKLNLWFVACYPRNFSCLTCIFISCVLCCTWIGFPLIHANYLYFHLWKKKLVENCVESNPRIFSTIFQCWHEFTQYIGLNRRKTEKPWMNKYGDATWIAKNFKGIQQHTRGSICVNFVLKWTALNLNSIFVLFLVCVRFFRTSQRTARTPDASMQQGTNKWHSSTQDRTHSIPYKFNFVVGVNSKFCLPTLCTLQLLAASIKQQPH